MKKFKEYAYPKKKDYVKKEEDLLLILKRIKIIMIKYLVRKKEQRI